MKTLAGSKRTAGTLLASPTKAAASHAAKRSRTQYDYCDEEDPESLPEDRWSAEMDSGSEMSIDGVEEHDAVGDESVAGPPGGPRSHRDSRDTQVMPTTVGFYENMCPVSPMQVANIQKEAIHPPPPGASITHGRGSTNTKKARGCTDCACSKSGKQCSASSCGCQGGPACQNPYKKLDFGALFGQEPVALHPCFMTWVSKQTRARLERTNTQTLFSLVFRTAPMLKEYPDDVAEPCLEWWARWDRLPASERNSGAAGLALKQELLRWGLTSRDLQSIYYSFCRRKLGWVEADHEWHCRACGDCMEWREWHCGNCNQCSYGLSLPCDNCGRDGDGSEDSELDGLAEDDLAAYWWRP